MFSELNPRTHAWGISDPEQKPLSLTNTHTHIYSLKYNFVYKNCEICVYLVLELLTKSSSELLTVALNIKYERAEKKDTR